MNEEKHETTKSKATRAEVATRVAEVLRIRLDGASFFDVCAYAKEMGWNVSERQCGRYLERADELLAEGQQTSRRRLIALHVGRREALFARAVNGADYRTALAIVADLAKLQAAYPTAEEVQEQSVRDRETKPAPLSREEMLRIARQAAAEVRAMEPDESQIVLMPPTE